MIYRGRFCMNVARLLVAIVCVISGIIYHNATRMTARCRACAAMSNLRREDRTGPLLFGYPRYLMLFHLASRVHRDQLRVLKLDDVN